MIYLVQDYIFVAFCWLCFFSYLFPLFGRFQVNWNRFSTTGLHISLRDCLFELWPEIWSSFGKIVDFHGRIYEENIRFKNITLRIFIVKYTLLRHPLTLFYTHLNSQLYSVRHFIPCLPNKTPKINKKWRNKKFSMAHRFLRNS